MRCFHCDEPVPARTGIRVEIDGVRQPMCCPGCAAVAELIAANGLTQYYRVREAPNARPEPADDPAASRDRAYDRPALHDAVTAAAAGGRREVTLAVGGMRCAACAWLIETALGRIEGVHAVSASFVLGRARVAFAPERVALSRVLQACRGLGYEPRPARPGAGAEARREARRAMLRRLVVAGLGAMQVMMYSVGLYAGYFDGMDTASRDFLRLLALVVATPVVLYSGWPFFAGAWRGLTERRPGMDLPVALALAVAWGASAVATFRGGGEVYLDSAVMFVLFLSVARYIEAALRERAAERLALMSDALPAAAVRCTVTGEETVAVSELEAGDRVRVALGEVVPADGELVCDGCEVDESLLTGESRPLARRRGDTLIAGSTVAAGPVVLRVTRVGDATRLGVLARLVERAADARPAWLPAADRIAAGFSIAVVLLAALTWAGWSAAGSPLALPAALAVLVVTCPCALALAAPAAGAAATAALARRGVLVTTAGSLERLGGCERFLFDKTGTLTVGEPRIAGETALGGLSPQACRQLAAAMEAGSRHPLARAFGRAADSFASGRAADPAPADAAAPAMASVEARSIEAEAKLVPAPDRHPDLHPDHAPDTACATSATRLACAMDRDAGLPDIRPEALTEHPGLGLEAVIGSRRYRLGRIEWVAALGDASMPPQEGDDTAVALGNENEILCVFTLRDRLRPEARETLERLGRPAAILSGDRAAAVAACAGTLGVDAAHAELAPEHKLAYLERYRAEDGPVAVVGDGNNDAAMLAAADVGIAVGDGSALALGRADIVVTGRGLAPLAEAVDTARRLRRVLRQNFAWALGYNALAIPLAVSGLLAPWLAAAGMSASSLLVVLNSRRLATPPGDGRAASARPVRWRDRVAT